MADKRSYTAGHFLCSIDGEDPAICKDIDGGNIKAEVVTIGLGPDNHPLKHISTLKFEPFTINVGMSMGKGLYEWIQNSLDRNVIRKNGYVVAGDFNYKAQHYRHFADALITEIGFPALDGSSKDASNFTVKFQPTRIDDQPGDGADLKGVVNTKQKKWLCSNFRIRLGDLPCARVSKIDAFTIKQGVVADSVGEFRVDEWEPSKLEIPNLKVTFSAADQKPWQDWFQDFVIRGNNGQEKELNGVIEYLDPSGKEVLGAVELYQVGIFSLNQEKAEVGKDAIKRCVAELYVERMRLKLNYV